MELTGTIDGSVEVVLGADGSRIHCVHAGSGPSVVLAHGYLLEHSAFEPVFGTLVRAGHRVIAFDQRGHGRSRAGSAGHGAEAAAADYAAVLEHFDVQHGVLVAHSMGGFLALLFCLRHPELAQRRLRRLVLLGANAGKVGGDNLQTRLQIPVLRSGLMSALWRFPPLGRSLVRQLFGSDSDPHCIELTRQMLSRQDVRLSLPLLQAMMEEDHYDRLHAIPIETRVLCGELDRTCPPSHSRRIGDALRNAQNRWLPRIGHMLAYEAPDAVIEAVGYSTFTDEPSGSAEQLLR
jgi:pimeloyl-ACP methyl ester carboxylesterase